MSNPKLEKYLELRKIQMDYIDKIRIFSINKNLIKKSARMLGMLNYKSELKLEFEDEINYIFDFACYEKITDNKSAAMHYFEHHKANNENEQKLFNMFLTTYSSLFIVTDTDEENSILTIQDYFTNEESEIIDINLSKTLRIGRPIFLRKLQFQDVAFASGIMYVFGKNIKSADDFFNDVEKNLRAVKGKDLSVKKFIACKNLNKKYGMDTQFQDVVR